LVDDRTPFIPLLSNTCKTLSGWPDKVAESKITTPGALKEEMGYMDSSPYSYGSFTLSASFRNIDGDPITALILTLISYAQHVTYGTMVPYPKFLVTNELDYAICPYRFRLDRSRRFITDAASCFYMYPISVNDGAKMNYSDEVGISDAGDSVEVTFQAFHPYKNDPIVLHNFNKISKQMNVSLRDGVREKVMVKINDYASIISNNDKGLFNYKGYPLVNLDTHELEWWVDRKLYKKFKAEYS